MTASVPGATLLTLAALGSSMRGHWIGLGAVAIYLVAATVIAGGPNTSALAWVMVAAPGFFLLAPVLSSWDISTRILCATLVTSLLIYLCVIGVGTLAHRLRDKG